MTFFALFFLAMTADAKPKCTIELTRPTSRQIFQRDQHGIAILAIAGSATCTEEVSGSVQFSLRRRSDGVEVAHATMPLGEFQFSMSAPGGWYRLVARLKSSVTEVDRVGAGEIFLIAGQSNSANHGYPRMTPTDDRVSTLISAGLWRFADDPQPMATSNGGSPWPTFGSELAHKLNVPIGIVSVGVDGSGVAEWLPSTNRYYPRLKAAIEALGKEKIRAVLWHQGEQDAQLGTTAESYRGMLHEIRAQLDHDTGHGTGHDAGYRIPWLVAHASFANFKNPTPREAGWMAEIRRGQELLWSSGDALPGPDTDQLVGPDWRWDGIHFNEQGLKKHGELWSTAVMNELFR